MKNVITNLLKIKSLITLVVCFVFVWVVITGKITTENIMVIISMVITFYFTKNQGGDQK